MAENNNNEEWQAKLLGKTLIKDDAETSLDNQQVVRMSELPPHNRVLPPGAMQTRDYRPDRLNVFVNKDYKVEQVYFG